MTVPIALALNAVGLTALGLGGSLPVVAAGAVVAGFGDGLLLPALLMWAVGPLTYDQRGRGTGVWTASLFIGQFICPLVILALKGALGGLGVALVAVAVASAVLAVGVRALRPTVPAVA